MEVLRKNKIIMTKIKQYGGEEIVLDLLLNDNDRKKFESFSTYGPSWWCAVPQFLNERHQKIGDFIGMDNDVFIDVGGHTGVFAIMFNKTAKKIYSLEPFSKNFEMLKLFTQSFQNIIPLPLAISTETKQQQLFIDNCNETQTSLILHPDCRESILVDSIRLDDFCDKYKIDKIDFLKIDIEGFELPLILDKSFEIVAARIGKAHIEVHNIQDGKVNITWEQVRELICNRLKQLGFELEIDTDMIFARNNLL
jgi:FkbM family methyltransferase